MKEVQIKANAKINLAIDVLGKRPDGYHEVSMIMQSLALADDIILQQKKAGITLETNRFDLAANQTNLAWRAAELLRSRYDIKKGVHIGIRKNIPIAAGLAGGSADAAAVLRGLNSLWNLELTDAELEKLGACLGSDVPFCIKGGTVLASGRGEILTTLEDLPGCFVVLAKPAISVSTAWVYQNFNPFHVLFKPNIGEILTALRCGDINRLVAHAANVLESVTITAYPVIGDFKNRMIEAGAYLCLMSGSGPTVFGLTDTLDKALHIAESLRKVENTEIYVTHTVKKVGEGNAATFTTG